MRRFRRQRLAAGTGAPAAGGCAARRACRADVRIRGGRSVAAGVACRRTCHAWYRIAGIGVAMSAGRRSRGDRDSRWCTFSADDTGGIERGRTRRRRDRRMAAVRAGGQLGIRDGLLHMLTLHHGGRHVRLFHGRAFLRGRRCGHAAGAAVVAHPVA